MLESIKDISKRMSFHSDVERLAFEEGLKMGRDEIVDRDTEIIALVDDDETILDMMSSHLRNRGYQTLTGKSGQECMALLGVNRPDLLVVDLGLNDINGEEICESVERDTMLGRMGVIVISGMITPEEAEKLNESEKARMKYKRYLSKPFQISVLLDNVREIRELQKTDGVNPWAPPLPLEIQFDKIPVRVTREKKGKKFVEEMSLKEKAEDYITLKYTADAFRPIILEILTAGKIRLETKEYTERITLINYRHHMVRSHAEELFDRHYPVRSGLVDVGEDTEWDLEHLDDDGPHVVEDDEEIRYLEESVDHGKTFKPVEAVA